MFDLFGILVIHVQEYDRTFYVTKVAFLHEIAHFKSSPLFVGCTKCMYNLYLSNTCSYTSPILQILLHCIYTACIMLSDSLVAMQLKVLKVQMLIIHRIRNNEGIIACTFIYATVNQFCFSFRNHPS